MRKFAGYLATFWLLTAQAWAALPIILIDSATGSDTNASGAGPGTAITGAACVTAADGLSVVIDGSPDLTGVATDGSHVIFMADTNSGSRNFGKITAKADSGTPTANVTVSDAFQALNTDICAIGGKRASIGGTTSRKLTNNAAASGDWMPGWRIRFSSGHSETGLTAALELRRAGDVTTGPMWFEAEPGAATKPVLSWSSAVDGISVVNSHKIIQGLDLKNTNGTKTGLDGIVFSAVGNVIIRNMKIATSGSNFERAINAVSAVSQVHIMNSDLGFTTLSAIVGATWVGTVAYNYIHDTGAAGYSNAASGVVASLIGNVFDTITGDGISLTGAITRAEIIQNTVYSATGDCIEISDASALSEQIMVLNNILSECGGFAINTGYDAAELSALGNPIYGNNWFNAASGFINPSDATTFDTLNLDPQFVDAASGNFAIGTNLKAKAYPQTPIGNTGAPTTSYNDPGAAQRIEAGGSTASFYIGG